MFLIKEKSHLTRKEYKKEPQSKSLILKRLWFYFYINFGKKTVARPRKIKNPNTSVKVVKNIDDAIAGSTLSLSKISGIKKPMEQAIIIFKIIAKNSIRPR